MAVKITDNENANLMDNISCLKIYFTDTDDCGLTMEDNCGTFVEITDLL